MISGRQSLLSLQMFRETYILVAVNCKKARDKQPIKEDKRSPPPKFKVRDIVLIKNHKQTSLGYKIYAQLLYMQVINDRAYALQDPTGHVRCASVADKLYIVSI